MVFVLLAASAGAAVLAALAAHGVGWVEKFTARPQVSVTTTRSPGMVDFAIRVESGTVEALAIDYHVSGHVVGVEPLNVGHHRARATATLEGEPVWPPYYTSRLHLDLRDMQGKAFNYKALWRPVQSAGMSVGVGGGVTDIDRYRVSYSWLFKGDRPPFGPSTLARLGGGTLAKSRRWRAGSS